jgi:RNA polymerase sigma-70 factor (ECF subfamily)
MEPPGDPELIKRARVGETSAFEDLLRPLIGPAARLAYAMLQDHAEAEDVVQESAVKAWRKLGNLRPGADFKPWFLGIVANQCRSVRRGSWWAVVRSEHAPRGDERLGLEDAAVRSIDLRRALIALPPDHRAALLLHFYLDLPLEAVAVALNLSVPGVKSRINRGLKRLRPSLRGGEVTV